MAKVIAIGNNKGGIGKTTTSVSLATGLAKEGKRVLAIDNDPQGNLSKCLGIDEPASLDITLETILNNIVNDIPFDSQSGIIKTKEGVDLMPTNIRCIGISKMLQKRIESENERLKKWYLLF